MVDHVHNRRNGRLRLFHKEGDYDAFERVLDREGPPTYWHPGNAAGPLSLLPQNRLPADEQTGDWPRIMMGSLDIVQVR
jgi:hypothetical protein